MRPIVIAAGGTGGHFFPAEALGVELIARGHRIALMTDARSGGLDSDVFAGQERFVLSGAGIAGRGLWRGAKAVAGLVAGTLQARRILARIDAAAVVGFGGYPCVAPIVATRLMRNPPRVILHDANAVLGRANRFLSRHATALALSFPVTALVPETAQTVLTGNPVRSAIVATPYEPPAGRIRLLVLGGSLGARVFSKIVPGALALLPQDLHVRLSVVQQCRAEDLAHVRAAYTASGIAAELATFFSDMSDRLAAASLVIARAGASTVAELAIAGRPAILVPLPGAIDDHQTANASTLAQTGASWLMPQDTFTAAALAKQLETLLQSPATLAAAAGAALAQARPDAAAKLADLVEALMKQEARS